MEFQYIKGLCSFSPGRNDESIRVSAHENLQEFAHIRNRYQAIHPTEGYFDIGPKRKILKQKTTHNAPAEAGPMALKSDINVMEIPLATPLLLVTFHQSAQNINPSLTHRHNNRLPHSSYFELKVW
jgi:hypothetical protein